MGTERIHVILDVADSRDCAERIGALHDLEHGRLVVRITPRVTSRSLLRDVLRALGKRLELPETPPRHRARELAALWIAAEKLRDVYVLRAHLLDAAAVRLILSIVTSTTDVWFVSATHELPPGIRDAIVEFVVDRGHGDPRSTENLPLDVPRDAPPTLDVRAFAELDGVEGRRPPSPPVPDGSWPSVPEDHEFWTFRSAVRELLSDTDFERIDDELHVGRIAAREWIGQRTGLAIARFRRGEVEAFLTGLLAPATSRSQALARVRGAQCALFLGGTLVQLPARGLAESRVICSTPLDRSAVDILRGFAAPRLAAAGAIALACPLPPSTLCKLALRDIGPDASYVTVNSARFSVPEHARSLVRAQVLSLVSEEGSSCFDSLFAEPETEFSPPISEPAMIRLLRGISRRSGLALLPDGAAVEDRAPSAAWLRDDALTVTSLASLGQRELQA
jgi:hypothetical protein